MRALPFSGVPSLFFKPSTIFCHSPHINTISVRKFLFAYYLQAIAQCRISAFATYCITGGCEGLYLRVARTILSSGKDYTFQWKSLYFPAASIVLLHGTHYIGKENSDAKSPISHLMSGPSPRDIRLPPITKETPHGAFLCMAFLCFRTSLT